MKTIKTILGIAAIVAVLGFAGTYDHAEVVISHMPRIAYEHVCLKLGDGASAIAIANEYQKNKEYYNSITE